MVRTERIGALVGTMPLALRYFQVARFVASILLLGKTILLKHVGNCPQKVWRMAHPFTPGYRSPALSERFRPLKACGGNLRRAFSRLRGSELVRRL